VQVGPYELLNEIARGGMGAVYEARDVRTGQAAAVKVILDERLGSGKVRQRFEREAEALSRVQHPGAVRLLGYAGLSGAARPFLAMELLEGESLQDWLDRCGTASPEQAVEWVLQACEAIEACHRVEVLHRDLKPANVFLTRSGALKLTDFGLARDTDPSTSRTQLTQAGSFLGTAGFWAPEQALGRLDEVGRRTDVHGLGALLYALLTGQPPRPASSLADALESAARPVDPPSRSSGAVPAWLDAVVGRALSARPEDRFASAADLAQALRAGPSASAPRWRAAALAGAVVVGALLAGVASRRPPAQDSASPDPIVTSPQESPLEVSSPTPAEAPDLVEALRQETNAYLAAERWDDTLEACDRWQAAAPAAPGPRCVRGQVWARRGELEAGLAEIRAGLALDPTYPNGHQMLAATLGNHGRLADGVVAISEAIRLAPEVASYRADRARFLFASGRYTDALEDFERAAELAPESAHNAHLRGRALALESRHEEAEQALRQALEREPHAAWAGRARAALDIVEGELELAALPPEVAALDREGRRMFREGRWGALLDVGSQLIELRPDHARGYQLRGVAHLKSGMLDRALPDLEAAARLEEDDAHAHSNLSFVLYRLERFEEGALVADRAVELAPTFAGAFENRALCRLALADLEGALADFERALELGEAEDAPKWRGMITRLRARLGLEVGDWAEAVALTREGAELGNAGDARGAIERFSAAIAVRPDLTSAYVDRALAYLKLEAYDAAVRDAHVAIELDGPEATALMLRGQARWLQGQRERAAPDLRQALELEPDAAWAPKARQLLSQARD
jgi:serine/threonine-protein kinase